MSKYRKKRTRDQKRASKVLSGTLEVKLTPTEYRWKDFEFERIKLPHDFSPFIRTCSKCDYDIAVSLDRYLEVVPYFCKQCTPTPEENKRLEQIRLATPKWADRDAIRNVYEQSRLRSRAMGFRYEVDHIVPLISDIVCGLHIASNLRIVRWIDNRKKGNRLDITLL